jgi:hypothetical protein
MQGQLTNDGQDQVQEVSESAAFYTLLNDQKKGRGGAGLGGKTTWG